MSIIKPKRKQQPLPQGRGFVAKRVCARSNKRGGREKLYFISLSLEVSRPEKTYRRKRNKPLQSDDFSSLRLFVREKFLKWYQIRLEVDFWTLQRKVRLLGLSQFHF